MAAPSPEVLPIDIDPVTGVLRARGNAVSRRDFLRGGGPSLLALAAGGIGVIALGSPGPSAQSFKDAYVRKTVDATQLMTETKADGSPMLELQLKDHITSLTGVRVIEQNRKHWVELQADHSDPFVEFDFDPTALLPASVFGIRIRNTSSGIIYTPLGIDVTAVPSGGPPKNLVGQGDGSGVITVFGADPTVSGGGYDFDDAAGTGTGTGAQIGLPTAAIGTRPNAGVLAGHRHAFSGRFSVSGFKAAGVLVGNPVKFKRFKFLNAFTVRRISVYALTAPVGNGETWGIVNAAGATQGTAVALNGGVLENEQAQTTNLTGNTAYYLAQIGVAATTPSADVNLEVEYTMNV